MFSFSSGESAAVMAVSMNPGATALTVMLREPTSRAAAMVKPINPAFEESWLEEYHLFQDLFAQPVVPLHYSKVKPGYETPIENVFLANMALVYPEDRGTNFAVDVGNKVAQLIDSKVVVPSFKE